MISAIVTQGFGSWGTIALVVTQGYAIGEAQVDPTPVIDTDRPPASLYGGTLIRARLY